MTKKLIIILGVVFIIIGIVIFVLNSKKSNQIAPATAPAQTAQNLGQYPNLSSPEQKIMEKYNSLTPIQFANVTVKGTIKDQNDKSIDGEIQFDQHKTAVTGGSFELKNIPVGNYRTIFIDKNGYPFELDQSSVQVFGDSFFDFKIVG